MRITRKAGKRLLKNGRQSFRGNRKGGTLYDWGQLTLKVGISITSAFGDKDFREGPRQMLARSTAAAGAGLSSLFVGDHHAVGSPS